MSKILIFTGAGLSAESGLSTFRDANGLWENHKIEEVCDFLTWENNYQLVHAFYNARRIGLNNVVPNKAHYKIAEWSKKYNVINITTNVDDLLERSGSFPLHLHGFLPEIICPNCKTVANIGYNEVDTINHVEGCQHDKLKPNVIFFNEMAPKYIDFNYHLQNLTNDDVVIVIGASLQVVPIHHYINNVECLKININPNLKIGQSTFYEDWIDISLGAVEGVEVADNILKEYYGR